MLNGAFVTVDLPDRHARLDRVGDPDRRGHGDRAVDRHRDQRAGVPGDAARARAGGRHRPAAGHRRVGRADGEERPARRGPGRRRRGRSARRSSASSRRATRGSTAPSRSSRDSSSRRCCSSAAVVGVIERRWTAAAAWCARRRGALSDRPDALVSVDRRRHGAEARAGVAVRHRLRDRWRCCSSPRSGLLNRSTVIEPPLHLFAFLRREQPIERYAARRISSPSRSLTSARRPSGWSCRERDARSRGRPLVRAVPLRPRRSARPTR